MNNAIETADVAVIGAGPAGALAAALLARRGLDVAVIEREQFPRFCVGESLLPQCMTFLEEAGLLERVNQAGFRYKNGAAFARGGERAVFDFHDKYSTGPSTTYQVERARFDQLLADGASDQGAKVWYKHALRDIAFTDDGVELGLDGARLERLHCRFVLDASGYGRVLSRLLNLEQPSAMPPRTALFTHIEDGITAPDYDRDKILITVHPDRPDIWYWLIPFEGGRASTGVIGRPDDFDLDDSKSSLRAWIDQLPQYRQLLANARFDGPVRTTTGYSYDVSRLYGKRFALLGNAAEFVDPVFSSGIAIAMKSASLAVPLVARELDGERPDWQRLFVEPLQRGVATFKTYVEAWYDGRFQEVIFFQNQAASPAIGQMLNAILAGYAWDTSNPFVAEPERRLNSLVALCRA